MEANNCNMMRDQYGEEEGRAQGGVGEGKTGTALARETNQNRRRRRRCSAFVLVNLHEYRSRGLIEHHSTRLFSSDEGPHTSHMALRLRANSKTNAFIFPLLRALWRNKPYTPARW